MREGGIKDVTYTGRPWPDTAEDSMDDVWAALVMGHVEELLDNLQQGKAKSNNELGLHAPAPPCYTNPPPSYDDALNDLPPEYHTIPPLAERKTATVSAVPAVPVNKSRPQSRQDLKVVIDFEKPLGVREHKKKKGGGAKKAVVSTPAQTGGGSDNAGEDAPNDNGGGDGGDAGGGDAGGDGGNGDDGGGDDWNGWTTSGSKSKKKKEEEEEQERLAKEEEERKAAEASAGNDLSWADDADQGGDDGWAGFATVGKKKKKGKVRETLRTSI